MADASRRVDLAAAIGFVVAHGDEVDRARLAYLRNGAAPDPELLALVEAGQLAGAGWPGRQGGTVASVDATCFRFAELDDLGALNRPPARQALDWLAVTQRPDGSWEEDPALADEAPPWARPGDPEARLYLTANAAFWLSAAGLTARSGGPLDARVGGAYAGVVTGAANAIAASLREDGTWPSYLVTGWLGAAVLFGQNRFWEAAQIQAVLGERLPDLLAPDVASLACALRRLQVGADDWLLLAAQRRLAEAQRSDGGWASDDAEAFTVHTTLAAIRACRPAVTSSTPAGTA
ncbi:MAG: squalene--hopene cyclase [Micromonosporaceae bacterium]|nr:squalene--hopene cyclase [Micromonosporaceae bacterium]